MDKTDEFFDINDPEWKSDFLQVFEELDEQWYREVGFLSSVNTMCLHPSYAKIVSYGIPSLIIMLEKMQKERKITNWGWFKALMEISGENPLRPGDAGIPELMMNSWVLWGIKNGYITCN